MTAGRRERREYKPHEKVLLVEGAVEESLIPWLMEANGISWPEKWTQAPVQIRDKNGYENILQMNVINTEVNEPKRQITGILLDADEHPERRWQSICDCCARHFPDLQESGFGKSVIISNNDTGKKLGIWMMPDNKSAGMLETLLQYLVPNGNADPLLGFAKESAEKAKNEFDAGYKKPHFDKACIHTWLAWQEEPGRQLHDAVKFGILKPDSPHAQPFVDWFRELFEV